jgi:hypothetical protein
MAQLFASLGWVIRSAHAVGADRFDEAARRARNTIARCEVHIVTPAERAVLDGLSASLDAVIRDDLETRQLLGELVSGIPEVCADEAAQVLGSAGEE